MKKVFAFIIAAIVACTVAIAGQDQLITFEQLPKQAQQFTREHFGDQSVGFIKKDTEVLSHSYEVIFDNGDKVEFDGSGRWTEIYRRAGVSTALLPTGIKAYLSQQRQGSSVVKLEKKSRNRYEVTLASGLELTMTASGKVLEID